MRPLSKIITVGVAVAMGTSLLTGVTTAYMLRSPSPAQSMTASYATTPVGRTPAVVAAHVVPAVARTTANTPRFRLPARPHNAPLGVIAPGVSPSRGPSVDSSARASAPPAAPLPTAGQVRVRAP